MLKIILENGQELDVNQNANISVNLNFNETDLVLRRSSYSKTLGLPNTDNNLEFFKSYYNLDITDQNTFNTKQAINVSLQDDDNVILNGILQLKNVDKVHNEIIYNVVIFDRLKSLYVDIADRVIGDLNLSEFSHERSVDAIVRSYNNINEIGAEQREMPLGSGYRYPHIFMQSYTDQSKILGSTQLPALFLKEYIDRIFSENGYTYTSEFFNSDEFKAIILPASIETLQYNANEISENGFVRRMEIGDEIIYTPFFSYSSGADSIYGGYPRMDYIQSGPPDFATNTQFIVQESGRYAVDFILNSRIVLDPATKNNVKVLDIDCSIELAIFVNDVRVASDYTNLVNRARINIDADDNDGDGTWIGPWLKANLTTEIDLKPGDIVSRRIKLHRGSDDTKRRFTGSQRNLTVKLQVRNLGESSYSFWGAELLNADDGRSLDTFINFNEVVPVIKQRDLITEVIKMFNLRVYEDQVGSTDFIIEPYDKLFNVSDRRILDWTNNVDTGKKYTVMPNTFDYAYYTMKYTDADDYFSKLYNEKFGSNWGDVEMEYYNDFTDASKEYKTKFSSTPSSSLLGDRIMPYFVDIDESGEYSKSNGKLRMLYWPTEVTPCSQYGIYDTPSDLTKETGEPLLTLNYYPITSMVGSISGRETDLMFTNPMEYYHYLERPTNNNIFNKYHRNYISQLTDDASRLVTYNINLTSSDLHNLQPFDKIFIDGNYYTIQSIKNWDKIKPTCEIVLIKDVLFNSFIPQTFLDTRTTEEIQSPQGDTSNGNTSAGEICPTDIVTKRVRFNFTNYIEYYSESGLSLSKSCCSKYDGFINASNGKCLVGNNFIDRPSDIYKPYGEYINDWFDTRDFRSPDWTLYGSSNYTNNSESVFARGTNNYTIGRNLYTIGNQNVVVTKDAFVFGNSQFVDKPGFYVEGWRFDTDNGTFEPNQAMVIEIWDGGDNLSYNVLKTNAEDILCGGADVKIIGQSTVNRDEAQYLEGNAPFKRYDK